MVAQYTTIKTSHTRM